MTNQRPLGHGARVETFEDLKDWLGQNRKIDLSMDSSWDDQVIWFVAVMQATEMMDSYTTKDLAKELIDGIGPITVAGVEDWLKSIPGYDPEEFETDEEADRVYEQTWKEMLERF